MNREVRWNLTGGRKIWKFSVTFRNTEGENWHKEYVDDRLKKMKKYIDRPVEAHVVLSVWKVQECGGSEFNGRWFNVNAKRRIKRLCILPLITPFEKIERQLKKHKERSEVIRPTWPGLKESPHLKFSWRNGRLHRRWKWLKREKLFWSPCPWMMPMMEIWKHQKNNFLFHFIGISFHRKCQFWSTWREDGFV